LSLPRITVYAAHDSPRLRYVLDWLLSERLGLTYRVTEDEAEALAADFCLAYGWLEHVPSIHASTLLREVGIAPRMINSHEWQGLHTLFFDEDSACDIQFDMLAGIFFLLTRYEEYYDFEPDRHGRYPATQSLLYRDNVLERPVADEWVEALRLFLQEVWGIAIPAGKFSFLPTYDIDIAWSYVHKGLLRSIGGSLQDLVRMNWRRFRQRIRVLNGQEPDPYNAFVWLSGQHMACGLTPVWFFLAALRPSRFDKNIPPKHPRMAALINAFSLGAPVGMHPSYYTDSQPTRMSGEKAALESIIGRPVTISRQHYIKLRFPHTYRALIAAGIADDYSMGYSTHFGFRAGTSAPFLWYDLLAEQASSLRVHPFAFMDTTGHYDLGLSAGESFQRLYAMAEKLIAANGRLITVFHNFSLGTDAAWAGWRKGYESFLGRITRAAQ
jgi:hypothetical protein